MGFVILLGLGGWYLSTASFDAGFDKADKEAQTRLLITQTDEARKRSEITERGAKARVKFMRAEDHAQNQRKILYGQLIDMHVAGLSFQSDKTNQGCGTGEDTDPQVDGGGFTTIRLPEPIEGNLFGMTENAQICVINYYKLRDAVKAMPNVVIVE